MAKYLDYDGLQYYTQKVKGTYNPQIENIKSNILLSLQKNGSNNLISYNLDTLKALNSKGTWDGNVYTKDTAIFTVNTDLSITVSGSTGSSDIYFKLFDNTKTYPLSHLSGCPSGGGASYYQLQIYKAGVVGQSYNDNGNGVDVPSNQYNEITITLRSNQTFDISLIFRPMLIEKSLYDAGFTDYQPYAMSNVELTHNVATNAEIDDIWDNT